MTVDLGLLFQGIAAGAGVVQAVTSALSIGVRERAQVFHIAKSVEERVRNDVVRTASAKQSMPGLDDEMIEVLKQKIEQAKRDWTNTISDSDDPGLWAQATDILRVRQCHVLRNMKQLNGGLLPGEWYKLWSDLQCQ